MKLRWLTVFVGLGLFPSVEGCQSEKPYNPKVAENPDYPTPQPSSPEERRIRFGGAENPKAKGKVQED